MSSKYRSVFGRGNGDYGEGVSTPQLPKFIPIKFNQFSAGFNVSDADQDVADASSPDALDMEVNKQDALVKAPGTLIYELLSVLKTPRQMALFVSLSLEQELLLFDPPFIGIKKTLNPIDWISTPIAAAEVKPFFWTTFADTFIFANGNIAVYTHEMASGTVEVDPLIPNGASFAVSAARLLVGGAVIDGLRQPMTMAWSGINGYNTFDFVNDLGSGFESLISDQSVGDEIIAVRPMGLDLIAVVCRNSIWIGRRTGDLDRPHDYQPRQTGTGAIAEPTVKTVLGGVIYLGAEGLEFFDGNKSTHISGPIDPDLLPIDYAQLKEYNSAYDPSTQRYMLFTPLATYVFDMVRNRWYKRSLVALAGVPFAESLPPVAWADTIGSWAEQYESWLTSVGENESLPKMTFLGVNSDAVYALHKESYPDYSNFGYVFVPRWQSRLIESPVASDLVTTDTISIRYKEGGSLDLYLPDINGALAQVNQVPVVLAVSSSRNLKRRKSLWTGMQAGWKIEMLSGLTEISEVELRVHPRGPRITPGYAFVPREYLPDF